MKRAFIASLVLVLGCSGIVRAECLRIMPADELVGHSLLIAVAMVDDVDDSEWGVNQSIVELELGEVIYGDTTLRKIRVGADSMMPCARDGYEEGEEVLVFLARDGGLYQTVNLQYGRFAIEGDTVKHWRGVDNVVVNASYSDVKSEIRRLVSTMNTPSLAPGTTTGKHVPIVSEPAEEVRKAEPPARKAGKPQQVRKLEQP